MTLEVPKIGEEKFYTNAVHYWSEIPATVDGMLGGFGFLSETDIKGSKMFLKQLFNCKTPPGRKYAVDCGAGIGRITKHLLTDLFEKVDLVEQNPMFLEKAKQYIGDKLQNKIGQYYSVGLQNFIPDNHKYDIIWVQWVLGHLTNTDLISFLKSCRKGLKPNGMIIVKENITSSNGLELDDKDSSVTRPLSELRNLFTQAGLTCYRQTKQNHFPKSIYSVFMFALKFSEESNENLFALKNDDSENAINLNQEEQETEYFSSYNNNTIKETPIESNPCDRNVAITKTMKETPIETTSNDKIVEKINTTGETLDKNVTKTNAMDETCAEITSSCENVEVMNAMDQNHVDLMSSGKNIEKINAMDESLIEDTLCGEIVEIINLMEETPVEDTPCDNLVPKKLN